MTDKKTIIIDHDSEADTCRKEVTPKLYDSNWSLISHFKNSNYQRPEIVSTLYAVWNNRIIRNQEITDELLIKDFYEWDKQKAKYERERLVKALDWMRNEGIVPDGWGKVIEKAKGK